MSFILGWLVLEERADKAWVSDASVMAPFSPAVVWPESTQRQQEFFMNSTTLACLKRPWLLFKNFYEHKLIVERGLIVIFI
jgi:hypothetical protein